METTRRMNGMFRELFADSNLSTHHVLRNLLPCIIFVNRLVQSEAVQKIQTERSSLTAINLA